ncbi:MAG TPA: WG repeat-containing protein [Candidatus Scatovivens faecipullorum]|nr:WG repeat-containing protein [Candidatus Scatovivens faecipullorum]
MSRNRGKRFDDTPRLNIKKVIATIIAIVVFIMIIVSLKNILTTDDKTNEVSSLTTYISVLENNKWGVIDNKANKVIDTTYDEMIIVPDKNKDIFICTYDVDYNSETYKTKVLNKDGNEILTEYNLVQAIENTDGNNVWYENNVLKFEKDGKFGLINFEGKEILKPEYDNIYSLTGLEKSLIIEKDGKKGLVNTSMGEIVIPTEYADITNLAENYEAGYIVKNSENKFGIISPDKTKILDTKYDEIKKVSGNGYYVVVENGKTEVVDKSGNIVLNTGFDSIESINIDNFIITKSGKYGVINKSGEELIPAEYDNLKFAFSNAFIAQKDGKYGIIDKSGNTRSRI